VVKNADVATFLRRRRAEVQPADVGLAGASSRRVPGLRREEVAMLAAVSVDYYARLEQGRTLQPSDQVLDSIARALRMNDVQRLHLHHLVRAAVSTEPAASPQVRPLREGTLLLLDGLDAPAMVLDLRGDVYAINQLGEGLLVGLRALPSKNANHTRWLFLDTAARSLLLDWEVVARSSVHVLREAAARHPHDAALHALIGELSVVSPEFRHWWAEHDVAGRCHGIKRFRHPVVGDLELHVEALQLPDEDRWLYTYMPARDSQSAQSLQLLSNWNAAPAQPQRRPMKVAENAD
jgi:transcriptional regulator with XRE-family HTH domain